MTNVSSVCVSSLLEWAAVNSEFQKRIHDCKHSLHAADVEAHCSLLSSSGKQPVDYPPWCEAIRKPDSCTVAVVMKANHKLPCLFGRKNRLWKSENDPLY